MSEVRQRTVKLEEMLSSLIERGYRGDRKKILRAVDITATALSQYAHGRTRPSFEKLTALAEFFDVSLDYLVYRRADQRARRTSGPLVRYMDYALTDVKASTEREAVADDANEPESPGDCITDRIDDSRRRSWPRPTLPAARGSSSRTR